MALPAGQASSGTLRLLLPLMDHLAGRGIEIGAFLAELGLPRDLPDDADARVSRAEQDAIWRRAIAVTGDPLLPARVAQRFPPETLGFITYLARASAGGVDAVARVRRFLRLIAEDGDLELAFEAGLAVLRSRLRDGTTPSLPVCEYQAALHVFLGRSLSRGTREPVEVRISHPAPAHAAELEALLGVPVRYGADCNAVAYPREEFRRPLRDADEGLSSLLESYAEELLSRIPPANSFVDRVRAAVAPRLAQGSPGIEDVAAALRMSARSVRRLLKQEGATYRSTLDTLRCELALRALDADAEPIDAIARDLGFSDTSAFYKAFRRWTGKSPAAYGAREATRARSRRMPRSQRS